MKKFAIAVGVVTLVLMTAETFAAKDRVAVIYMTQNYGTKYPAPCLGTVATETLPSKKGDNVTWIILNGNAVNGNDVCPSIDKAKVALVFDDDVMGTAAMRHLSAASMMYNGKTVFAVTGMIDPGIPKGAHKYQVQYMNMAAGPDPEIEVDCPGCGGE